MKVARIVFVIAAVLIVAGVVLGAIPRSAEAYPSKQEISCGSVFFPRDDAELIVPFNASRGLAAEDCRYATNEAEPWVLMGLGGLAVVLGVAILRGQRKEASEAGTGADPALVKQGSMVVVRSGEDRPGGDGEPAAPRIMLDEPAERGHVR